MALTGCRAAEALLGYRGIAQERLPSGELPKAKRQAMLSAPAPRRSAKKRAPFAESPIPPKQPPQLQNNPTPAPHPNTTGTIRILTQPSACAIIDGAGGFVCQNSTSHLEASSGQGENPYRRYSPRTVFGDKGRGTPTRCDSGADSTVWMREGSGESRPYMMRRSLLPLDKRTCFGGLCAF